MSCTDNAGSQLPNADLFDWQSSESQLRSIIANGQLSELHCPFPTAALIACSAFTLCLQLILLSWAASLLSLAHTRGLRLCGSNAHFTARYCLIVLVLSAAGVTYNVVRLVALTVGVGASVDTDGDRLLLLSFSQRGGGSFGMNVLLWLQAVSLVAAVGYSVDATVGIARKTASRPSAQQQSGPPVAFVVQHFRRLVIGVVVFNGCVWLSLFFLPLAAASSHAQWAQLAIGLLLISLGNLAYWTLAVSVSFATKAMSRTMKVAPMTEQQPGQAASHAAGLNESQTDQRNKVSWLLLCASRTISLMLTGHLLGNVAFFSATLAAGASVESPVLPYWLFFTQAYWCCVCFGRMLLLRVPQPQLGTGREAKAIRGPATRAA